MYNDENLLAERTSTTDETEKLKRKLVLMMGEGMIDTDIEDEHLDLAIELAIDNYRAWGANSREDAFLMLKLQESQTAYTLPQNVDIVHKVLRRGNGLISSGTSVEPFSQAFANTYLLNAARTNSSGGLLTYELYHQFDETIGRLFGRELMFHFNSVTKKITIERDIRSNEEVVLQVRQAKPDVLLLLENTTKVWIRDWALSECKMMLGRARSKISSIPGPNGSWQLDGNTLLQEATQMQEELKQQLKNYRDGSVPPFIIIG